MREREAAETAHQRAPCENVQTYWLCLFVVAICQKPVVASVSGPFALCTLLAAAAQWAIGRVVLQ